MKDMDASALKAALDGVNSDAFMSALQRAGISCFKYYPGKGTMEAFGPNRKFFDGMPQSFERDFVFKADWPLFESLLATAYEESGDVSGVLRMPDGEMLCRISLSVLKLGDDGKPEDILMIAENSPENIYGKTGSLSLQLAEAASEGVLSAFYVDLDNDTYTVEHLDGQLRVGFLDFINSQKRKYSETVLSYCEKFVVPEDKGRVLAELSIPTMREKLAIKHSYFCQYRISPNKEGQGYFEAHFVDASDVGCGHRAFLFFRCIDEQKEREIKQREALAAACGEREEYAKRAQENLDIIIGTIGSALWYMEFSPTGKMAQCYWSNAFRKMLGFDDESDFPNAFESWSNRLHDEDRDRVLKTYWDSVEGKATYDLEYRLMKKDGEYGRYRAFGQIVRYSSGQPRLFVGTLVDLAEARQKERMQEIISSIASIFFAVWVINVKNNTCTIVSLSEEYRYQGNELYSEAVENLFLPQIQEGAMREKVRAFLDVRTLDSRLSTQRAISLEYMNRTGHWYTGSIIPSKRDRNGLVEEFLLGFRDVDQEKKQEAMVKKALEDAYEAASRANSAKSDFLSNMSHDIRTPMNAIIGMTAIAGTHIDDKERVQDCLQKITVSSKHLLGLINEVLDMSKIESGKLDLNAEDFDLSDLVDNLLSMVKPQIEAMHHELSVDIRGITHEHVTGDSQRLQQAFMNLMSNAIKYTPDGGRIKLTISEKPTNRPKIGCFEFVFEDNGIGMSEEYLKHVFDPFSRADDERVAKKQGTGLGMSITRNIVNMMNGDIEVESKLGEGTKFTVTIFLALQDVDAAEDNAALQNLPVLVTDDDKITCISAVDILKQLGMDGEWVLTGAEAVEKAVERHKRNDDYFAVILDWKMPGMDGIETTKALRKAIGNEVPIIIISAYDWSDIELEARSAGANAFISKPLFKSRMSHLFKGLVNKDSGIGLAKNKDELERIGKEDFSGRRVLLVEDNELNAEIAGEILEMTHLTVDHAKDGKEALDKMVRCKDGYYDAVFMDIQMPIMNGYEATRAIRSIDRPYLKKVPIIAMTANAFAEDVEAARDVGMNEHIAKPIDFAQLVNVLNKWLKD